MMPGWDSYTDNPKIKKLRQEQQRIKRELLAAGKPASAKEIERLRKTVVAAAEDAIPAIDEIKYVPVIYPIDWVQSGPNSWYQLPSSYSPPPPPPLPPEETIVTAITGWRCWSVDMFGSTLKSNNRMVWEPFKRLEAECKRSDNFGFVGREVCAGIHCSCGIYAYKSRSDAELGENAPINITHVWGEVYLWGRVIEHKIGYRAQYAYPKAFINTGGIARQLALAYGVKLI